LPIDWDMCRYIAPCLGMDVPAVTGSRSFFMHRYPRDASVLVLYPCPRDASRSGRDWQSGRSARIDPKPRARLVWSGLALKDAWAPDPIPNCKKTELRLGYRACQSNRGIFHYTVAVSPACRCCDEPLPAPRVRDLVPGVFMVVFW